MRDRIQKWHELHCDRLEAAAAALGAPAAPRPKCVVVDGLLRRSRRSGEYSPREKACYYSLAFALAAGPRYEETVAHEVVHHYQEWILPGSAWHGELFSALAKATGLKVTRCHDYDVRKARLVAQLLKTRRALQAQEERA